MAWLHMHQERPQAMGWGSKAILKDEMTKWAES